MSLGNTKNIQSVAPLLPFLKTLGAASHAWWRCSSESCQVSHQEQPGLGSAEMNREGSFLAVTSRGNGRAFSKHHHFTKQGATGAPNTLRVPRSKCKQKHWATILAAEDPASWAMFSMTKARSEHKLNVEIWRRVILTDKEGIGTKCSLSGRAREMLFLLGLAFWSAYSPSPCRSQS